MHWLWSYQGWASVPLTTFLPSCNQDSTQEDTTKQDARLIFNVCSPHTEVDGEVGKAGAAGVARDGGLIKSTQGSCLGAVRRKVWLLLILLLILLALVEMTVVETGE